MEQSFFKFLYHPQYLPRLLQALKKAVTILLKNSNKDNETVLTQVADLEKFFSPQYPGFSLFQAILAINMVKYRRFFILADLVMPHTGHIFQSEIYLCSYEVFETMMQYLKNKQKELEDLNHKLKELAWLDWISAVYHAEDILEIEEFYKSQNHDWEEDKKDTFLLILLLVEGLVGALEVVQFNYWQVMSADETTQNMKISIGQESAHEIKQIIEEIEMVKGRYSTVMPEQIPLENYLSWKSPELYLKDKNKRFFYQKFQEIFSMFQNIGKSYKEIIAYKDNTSYSFLRYMVIDPPEMSGKAVFQVYEYYLSLIMKICRYFKEQKLVAKINSAEKIRGNIRKIEADIDNLTDSANIINSGLQNTPDSEENEEQDELEAVASNA